MFAAVIASLFALLLVISIWGSILVALFYGVRLLVKWFKKKYDEL